MTVSSPTPVIPVVDIATSRRLRGSGRLADELDRLDAAEDLDPARRARAVARLCAVALAVHKQAGPFGVGERDAQIVRTRLAELALLARAAIETSRAAT